ncbi:DUF4238 domain-containing protein [Shinella sp. HZN7]|uniref:DUF4238 domain-containing protein n=1 Tax=Shinella sp. (strain HZN7) TaxID=879274 RepID=UPI000A001B74|nr:DUF4238 domain-containing protein [Shinella sp. HZN7]
MSSIPRDHHYVPQFYLRNFAIDPGKQKLTTVTKHGHVAVWAKRSIKSLGFERDLYVSMRGDVPVSVESIINERIETPISKSDTWQKISSGNTAALDKSDKPILYALIRHLNVRTPHYLSVTMELARMAGDENSAFPFTDEEREHYAHLRSNPNEAKAMFNLMSMSTTWAEADYRKAAISIFRSPIPLRTLSSPVMSLPAPYHPALYLPKPGMIPFQFVLALNPTTIATLVLGNFGDVFTNDEMPLDSAIGYNRSFVAQFAHFDGIRHLVTSRDDLSTDMTWAPYSLVSNTEQKITYRRKA